MASNDALAAEEAEALARVLADALAPSGGRVLQCGREIILSNPACPGTTILSVTVEMP